MIRIQCKGCGSKLNAKAKLAGQTRKCPKCGTPIVIPAEAASSEAVSKEAVSKPAPAAAQTQKAPAPTPIIHANPAAEALPSKDLPKRLDRNNRYLICDKMNIRAAWNNDGRGWMLKISSGFSPAKLNREDLPAYGDFTLVELVMKHTEEGIRLDALEIYKLASRFAMPKLQRGDDDICESITDRGTLSREQKASVYQIFKTLFMREVWGDSRDVVEFLLNADYHSHTSRGTEVPKEQRIVFRQRRRLPSRVWQHFC